MCLVCYNLQGYPAILWQTEDVRWLVMCLVCYNLQVPSNLFDKQRMSDGCVLSVTTYRYPATPLTNRGCQTVGDVSCLLQLTGTQQPLWQTEDVRRLRLVCYNLQVPSNPFDKQRMSDGWWCVLCVTTYSDPITPLTNRGAPTVGNMCLVFYNLQDPSNPVDKQRMSDSWWCVLSVAAYSNPFDKQRMSDSEMCCLFQLTGPLQPLWQTEDVWQTVTLMTVFVTGPQQPLWQTEDVWQGATSARWVATEQTSQGEKATALASEVGQLPEFLWSKMAKQRA